MAIFFTFGKVYRILKGRSGGSKMKMMNDDVRFTIITPSFNQGAFIERTIRSVLDQAVNFRIEYLVIDGGSTDDTLEILKKYEGRIRWYSQLDKGQSDAINFGLSKANGKIIGWLNSDDLYLPGALQKVSDYFDTHPEKMWIYGRCRIINNHDREIRRFVTLYKNLISGRFRYKWLLVENYISQPAVFLKKELLEELGQTDTNLHYTMDYEMWLRIGARYPPGVIRDDLAGFRRHSLAKSERNFRKQFREGYIVAGKMHKGWLFRFLHKVNMLKIIVLYRIMRLLGV